MIQNRILIVDDEQDILDLLEDIFTPDYLVSRACSVQEALDILSEEVVQLIISDVMMPGGDGFNFCRLIKSTLAYSDIPVLLLTAKNTIESKIEGLETKADAYMEKPFSKKHLEAQVESLLANRYLIKRSYAENPLAHIKTLAVHKKDQDFLLQIESIIQANIAEQSLNVDYLARTLNLTRMTLYRKISSLTGLSPSELISVARLKKAALLITENKYRLFEIALMVGFADHSSFTRSFQTQFGMSPREFSKSINSSHS